MLSSKYPEYIETKKRRYKLNTDFRVAVRCFEVINDTSIDDYERNIAITYLLTNEIPFDDLEDVNKLLIKYLQCGESNEQEQGTRDMDLLHDEKYIEASFMSDYHMDLSQVEYLHWWQFITLIQGLTNDCILNRVREIRTMDIKDFKGKARTKIVKAKEQLALPPLKNRLTQEEEDALDAFYSQLNENKEAQPIETIENEQL